LGGEGHIAFQQIIIGRVNVEKHLVNLGIDLHSLTALAIQSARTGIPQIRSTRRFTGELRHRILALTSEQVRAVDGKGEIDPIPPISISPSDIKQLDFYRTKRTDPDIIVIQLKQNSAPH